MKWVSFTTALLILLITGGCRPQSAPVLVQETQLPVMPSHTATPYPLATRTPTPSPSPSPSPSPTASSTPTHTPTQTTTPTPTITPIPTYTVLRGEVLQRANCRYGPGWMYLYKYGLVVGSNLEIIGRTELGDWLLIQAIGGNNPCWVKADLMAPSGDVMAVKPLYLPLPQSPYYGPVTGVSATRNGNEVTISWRPITLRPGDDMASPVSLVETWVCQQGKLVFTPVGTDDSSATVVDEPGCDRESYGRVYGVEKHGYTNWIKIPWPAHPENPPFQTTCRIFSQPHSPDLLIRLLSGKSPVLNGVPEVR